VRKTKPRTVKGKGGRVPGVAVTSTPASAAASRVAAWKTGKYARVVTVGEVYLKKLAEQDPDFPGLLEGYLGAIEGGSLEHPNAVTAVALAQRERRRRQIADSIEEKGVVLHEAIVDADGKHLGYRLRANPLLEAERDLARDLGHTAEAALITRKSRGEGAKDEAMTAALRRDALLRSAPKEALAPPPDEDIPDAEIVP